MSNNNNTIDDALPLQLDKDQTRNMILAMSGVSVLGLGLAVVQRQPKYVLFVVIGWLVISLVFAALMAKNWNNGLNLAEEEEEPDSTAVISNYIGADGMKYEEYLNDRVTAVPFTTDRKRPHNRKERRRKYRKSTPRKDTAGDDAPQVSKEEEEGTLISMDSISKDYYLPYDERKFDMPFSRKIEEDQMGIQRGAKKKDAQKQRTAFMFPKFQQDDLMIDQNLPHLQTSADRIYEVDPDAMTYQYHQMRDQHRQDVDLLEARLALAKSLSVLNSGRRDPYSKKL